MGTDFPSSPLSEIIPTTINRPIPIRRDFFEAAAMRQEGPAVEVYLCKQPKNDPRSPGSWTLPRLRLLHGESKEDVAHRIEKEFGGVLIQNYEFVCFSLDDRNHDETFFADVHLVQLANEPLIDGNHWWFPTNNLPVKMVDQLYQRNIIPKVLYAYLHRILK